MRLKSVSYAKYGYLFTLPFIIIFLVFSLYPIIYTVMISFTDLKGMKTALDILRDSEGNLNPFGNYVSILGNATFKQSIGNTAIIWFMNFLPQILLALLFAAWFTSKRIEIKGQGAFKVLFYMPNIITAATIAILFNVLFAFPEGLVNDLRKMFGAQSYNFTANKTPVRMIIAFIQFWMWYGYTMLILISGILGINPELFEAAEIDGASSSQTFFQITLPSLRTIMIFTLVTSLIGGLQMFDIPQLFNAGQPAGTSQTVSVFIYVQAYGASRMMNTGAAASLILFVIIAIFSSIIFYLMRDRHEEREKRRAKAQRRAFRT